MARMRNILAVSTVGLLALTACSGAGSSGAGGDQSNDTTATIGVFLPLTGENADNGQQIEKALELYVAEYNEGDHKYDIELIIRDDRGEPKTATNVAREFAENDEIIAALGSFTSTAAMAAAPVFDSAGIPQISPTSSHPDFTGMGKYVFRGTPTQDKEAKLIAEYLKEEVGEDESAVIYRQDDWGISASDQFEAGYAAAGGDVTSVEAVAPDARDFRTMVTSLKNGGTDSVYLALQYSDAGVLAQQMAASAWSPTVITATSLYTHELIELAGGEALEGWLIPAFFFAESPAPNVQKFVEGFTERYDEHPNAFAAAGYDSISMIGAALDEITLLGKDGREQLGQAMFDVEVEGATGKLKFDENGDVEKEITWLVIRDSEFHVVE